VDFDACIRAIEALVGRHAEVEVWGLGEDAAPVAFGSGTLVRPERAPLPAQFKSYEGGETAAEFEIGDTELMLWPSRFHDAERYEREWLEVRTADAVVRIGPYQTPWS
jgi:hypothetical protein